jgi:hypothetical protein
VLVHNGREVYRGGPRPNHLAIGADGASLAHSESRDGKVRIVVDGEPGEWFGSVENLSFAPDGRTPVYLARREEETFVIVGSKRHGPMTPLTDLVYNDAGDKLALVARIGREIWRKAIPIR